MNKEIETITGKLTTYTEVLVQVLDLIPDDKLDWKPFDDFRSLGEQVIHIAQTEKFYLTGITEGQWDFHGALMLPGEPFTKESIKARFDVVRARTISGVDMMTEIDLERVVEIPNNPTRYSVRHWLYYLLEHLVHHKAQLSVFLRQLG
ncbi:MAG: DinB family protein, partial [Pyrinomonadaceae bacterium]